MFFLQFILQYVSLCLKIAISSTYPSILVTCIYNTAGRRSQNELGAINRSYFELVCFCDFCVEAQLYNGSCGKYNWEDPAYFYF
jgi:hypothetical protein